MTETSSQIAFEELGLGSSLKWYHLNVPPNQRDYAWTDKEVNQMLRDYAKAITQDGPYFLGTIVTIPRGEGTLEVVDGQQRLATTALLLAAIRDYLMDKHEDLIVQSISTEFLSGIDRKRRELVPKLKLNLDDNEIFKQIITGKPEDPDPKCTRASHERLLASRDLARDQVRRAVAPLDPKEHGDALNRWVSFVEHRALVVLLKVPDDSDAYRMFETLNDRGLRTSQADLVKNFLFGRSGSRIAEVQSRWSYMRGTLEAATDDPDITINFLRHAMIVQQGHMTAAEVYDNVQASVKSEANAVTFGSTIEVLAGEYVATFNPEHEKWNGYPDGARRAIEVFGLFDIKPMRPLILAVASKMSPKEASLAFQFLISLGVRLIIASSTRSGSVEVPMANAASDVYCGTVTTAAKLRKLLAPITPDDAQFRVAFETARVSNAKFARYYLRSLEMAANAEPEPWFMPVSDPQVINLEHVLPKKPEENWPEFGEEEVRQLTTRLGNLALMRASDNSNIKSQAFEAKKLVYAQSPYALTSRVAEFADWTSESIAARQKTLAELAVGAWPV
jgi:hypothetical protein